MSMQLDLDKRRREHLEWIDSVTCSFSVSAHEACKGCGAMQLKAAERCGVCEELMPRLAP